MTEDSILNSVASKLKEAVSFSNSNIALKQEKALKHYKRDLLPGDAKIKGSSKWVSPEVAQRVDWLNASLIRIFDAPESVCEFVPFGPEDEAISRQQTQVVNWILQTKNSHLSFLHPWLQNGLITGLGVVTVEFDVETLESLPRLVRGIPNEQLVALYQQEEQGLIVIEEASKPVANELGIETRDLKIRTIRRNPIFNVLSVPPEDFIVSKDAKFSAETGGIEAKLQGHRKYVSKADLLDMGYDAEKVKAIPLATNKSDGIALVRTHDLDGEQGVSGDDVEVYQVYCRLKIDTKPRHYRLTLAGDLNSPVLLDYEETSRFYPYSCFVPFPIADTLFGLGVVDKIADDHVLLTQMTRAMLDDLHQHVNPIKIVNPDVTNLDDLMNMHPGKVVRSADPAAGISYNVSPFAGGDAMPVMQSLSQSLDFSTGVGPQMASLNAADLGDVTATAVNQRTSSGQLLVEMVSRFFADTGYRYLVKLVVDQLIQKPEAAQELISRLTNQYVPLDEFSPEFDVCTSVAFGVMSRDQRLGALTNLLGQQMAAMQAGLPIVQPQHIYATMAKLAEASGFKNTSLFFVDPSTLPPAPPPPPPQDPNAGLIQIETVKAQLKAQSDEADRQFQQAKFAAELDLKRAQMQIDAELKAKELELKYAKPVEQDTITIVEQVPSYPEAYV